MTSTESTPLLSNPSIPNPDPQLPYSVLPSSQDTLTNQLPSNRFVALANKLFRNKKRITILIAIWTGVFLGALDATIVATLMSAISSGFSASNQSSWLASAYLLAISITAPLYGKLSDLLGRRIASLTSITLFLIGTIGCGISRSINQLILSRFIAGCGGGGIMTTSSIIATDLFSLDQRALIQGLGNICYGLGASLGGPLGGWINDHYGWRFAFLTQVPILLIAWCLVSYFVDYRVATQVSNKADLLKRIDWLGSFTLMWTIVCLLLSLSFKNNLLCQWSDVRVFGTFVGFLLGLVAFIWIEARASEPILPLRLLKLRTPLCCLGLNFFSSIVFFAILYMFPLWFETVKLTTTTQAGLHLIPNSASLSIGSLLVGAGIRLTGKYKVITVISSVSLALGLLLLSTKLNTPIHEWADIILVGIGFSAISTAALVAIIASIPSKDMAVCTGLTYLFRYTGQVVGVAASAALLQSIVTGELERRIVGPGSAEIIRRIRHESSIVKNLPDGLYKTAAIASYKVALRDVFRFNLFLTLVVVALSFGVRDFPLVRP
ncbi:hypothetical protein O181_020485 [Austropuccinia psidii MF-1]|uniref:Major facilitator superfamily (MFS) profile domain-containing protein n=1 Tax=Austropuccinia psidii MF-1 TaxID=1389203 RepID=A0A9Q3CCN6_9BASI|nr:hypothetical protein [Austropuccinia psidii MF-1]